MNLFFMDHDKVLFMAIYNPTRAESSTAFRLWWLRKHMTIHKYKKSCCDLCNTKTIKRHAEKLSTLLLEATQRENTDNYLAISFSLLLLC